MRQLIAGLGVRQQPLDAQAQQRITVGIGVLIGNDDEASFKPFALGYVEFPGQVIVEGRILTDDPHALHIGQPMRVELETFETSTRGARLTYAFRPIN